MFMQGAVDKLARHSLIYCLRACVIACMLMQFSPTKLRADQPAMRLFSTSDGLVRNWVNRIRRDSQGRLWFCTVGGLSLYDGQRFTNYRIEDGLPDRMVNDIAEASGRKYLLATDAGLFVFQARTLVPASFEPVPFAEASKAEVPQILLKNRSGDFYCGTRQGHLYLIQKTDLRRAKKLNLGNAEFGGVGIEALAETEDGSIWAGGAQLVRLQANGETIRWANKREVPSRIRALMVDSRGLLWIGGGEGFSTLDPKTRPTRILRYRWAGERKLGDITSLYEDRSQAIWGGTFGLFRLLHNSEQGAMLRPIEKWNSGAEFYEQTSLLGSQWINAVSEDSAGNIWVAVGNIGVARLKPEISQYTTRDGLEAPQIQSVFEASDGYLYAISGTKHTLNRFDGRRFKSIPILIPPNVHYVGWGEDRLILKDREGEWWLATGEGLLRYPKVDNAEHLAHTLPKARYLTSDGLPDNAITRVFEDRDSNIWVATAEGVVRWTRAKKTFENYTVELKRTLRHTPSPLSFATDKSGSVWIGFAYGGLARFRNGQMRLVTKGIPAGSINGLLSDHRGRLWIASSRGGLAVINDPLSAEPIACSRQHEAGIRGQHLYALAEDLTGRLYVAGGEGVDRFDPSTGKVDHFDVSGGLPLGETQRLYCDHSGAIWFASNFGLSRLQPGLDQPARPSDPVIHDFIAAGTRVAASDEGERLIGRFKFPAHWNSIQIMYGNTTFATNETVTYRYRLVGLDASWHGPVAERSIRYGGLGPGSYRFEVQSVNSAGLSSLHSADVEFSVGAPFWRTWWFMLLSAISTAAAALAWHRSKLKHAVALERIRAGFAADLHDDLGSGLTEIAILSEVAKRNDKITTLDEVAKRARELRESMADIVWSADPRRDNVEEFIQKCRQAAFALLGDQELEFRVRSSPSLDMPLPPLIRCNLLRLYKEALTNVARHARSTHTLIEIAVEGSSLLLKISDDGCGFSEPKDANGLVYMKERAAAMQANLSISSESEAGTVVEVVVPLKAARARWRASRIKHSVTGGGASG